MFNNHFGREVSKYDFSTLTGLVAAMPNTVQRFTNDTGIQFVQSTKAIMLDQVCKNLILLLESKNNKLQLDLTIARRHVSE
jgi:hypothetical protein